MLKVLFALAPPIAIMAVVAYAAPTGILIKVLGGGSGIVAHCQVLNYQASGVDLITSVNARVVCDTSGEFRMIVQVHAGGESGSGESKGVNLTAEAPSPVVVAINPPVPVHGFAYSVDLRVKK